MLEARLFLGMKGGALKKRGRSKGTRKGGLKYLDEGPLKELFRAIGKSNDFQFCTNSLASFSLFSEEGFNTEYRQNLAIKNAMVILQGVVLVDIFIKEPA